MSFAPSLLGRELGCIRGDTPIFRGVNFQILQGESLQVKGANGVGKSSLLRLIAGLLPVSSGKLQWQEPAAFSQRCLLINHKQGLKTHLTVVEMMRYWSGLQPGSSQDIGEILAVCDLTDLAEFPTALLSQGQRQRLNLCRLQIFSAWLWLLDEPFSGLDTDGQKILCSLMQAHQQQGGSVIFVSHQSFASSKIWQPNQHLDLTLPSLLREVA